jgi:hypothetical protein
MQETRTLIQAIGSIKSDDYKVRFRNLQSIYEVYAEPFNRLTVISLFELPKEIAFEKDKANGVHLQINKKPYFPKTVADFVSLVDSLGDLEIKPKFKGNELRASVLWNRNK